MSRREPEPLPRVQVRTKTKVVLSTNEVVHCLRCWLMNKLAPTEAPMPKSGSMESIEVEFDSFGSVILTYEPAPIRVEVQTQDDGECP